MKLNEHDISTKDRIAALETRVRRIEAARRRNRRMLLASALLGAVILAAAWDKAVETVISAREFVLVDEAGRERGGMRITPEGPWLGLKTEAGHPAVGMLVLSNGPWFGLFDEHGARIRVAAAEPAGDAEPPAPSATVDLIEPSGVSPPHPPQPVTPSPAPAPPADQTNAAAQAGADSEEPVMMDAIDKLFEALKMDKPEERQDR